MKKVRVGIIGVGSWGEFHLETYRSLPNAEVVAVCDRNSERLDAVADRYGIAARYGSESELLDRGDIDLVSVVTTENNHYGPVIGALRSGKHVLVEKPVSTKASEAREMLAVAAENGRYIIPGHLLRFDPRYAEIHHSIQTDGIGTPVSIFLKRGRQKSYWPIYQRTHTVLELMVHDIDLAIWYAASRVRSVKAYGRSHAGENPAVLWACLEFENQVLAILQSNWLTPDEAGIAVADSAEVIGERGVANFETSNAGLQVWTASGRTTLDPSFHFHVAGRVIGDLRELLGYACDCIAEDRSPDYVSFQDAVHGIEVSEAITESAKTGRAVDL